MTINVTVDKFSMYDQLLNSPALANEVAKVKDRYKDKMVEEEWPTEYYRDLDNLMKAAVASLYEYVFVDRT